jgi:hypothetical protein
MDAFDNCRVKSRSVYLERLVSAICPGRPGIAAIRGCPFVTAVIPYDMPQMCPKRTRGPKHFPAEETLLRGP